MRNLWRAFIRMLPKRVLLKDEVYYYPQVWFIWWHSVWYIPGVRRRDRCYDNLEKAKYFLEHYWDPIEVVWRSGQDEFDEIIKGYRANDWKE